MSKEAVLKTIQDLLSENAEQSAIKESLIQSLIDYTNVKGTFIVPVHADEDGGNLPVLFEDANKNPYLLAYTTSEQFQDSPEFESKNKTIEMTVDALAKHILMRADLFGMILDQYPIVLILHRCISIALVFFLAIHIFVFHKKL